MRERERREKKAEEDRGKEEGTREMTKLQDEGEKRAKSTGKELTSIIGVGRTPEDDTDEKR